MNYHLITNRRPGRSAEMVHLAGVGCSALARAKYTRDFPGPGAGAADLDSSVQAAQAIVSTFDNVSFCRKCRSAARQLLAIQKLLQEKMFPTATKPVAKSSVSISVEMSEDSVGYGQVHRSGCGDLLDGMAVGDARTLNEASGLVEGGTGWAPGFSFAGCLTDLLNP